MTDAALEALVLGVHLLGVRRILVVPHTRCAMATYSEHELRAQVKGSGGASLRTAEVAMVGDDPRADIAAARRVGLRGVLVLTGKVTADEAAASGVRLDAVAPSLAEVVAALEGGSARRQASGSPPA